MTITHKGLPPRAPSSTPQRVRKSNSRNVAVPNEYKYHDSQARLSTSNEFLFSQITISAKLDMESGYMHMKPDPLYKCYPPPSGSLFGKMKESLSNTKLANYFLDRNTQVVVHKFSSPPNSMANFTSLTLPQPSFPEKDSFEVLGVELAYLSTEHQYLLCASGVMTFLLLYGYLQEKIIIEVFDRKFGLFVSFLQFGGYSLFCFIERAMKKAQNRKIPLKYYILLALMAALIQSLTNLAMQSLNYPVKVIFKSSRIVPVMLVGVSYYRKRYARRDYIVAFLMVFGLITFMQADSIVSPKFDVVGIVYICTAMLLDAINVNIQEDIMNKFHAPQDEFVLYTYTVSAVFMFASSLFTGEFWQGLTFAQSKGFSVWIDILLYSGAGYFGVTCASAITKRFGAFASSMTTTARKALTLCLSFFFFPKPVTTQHFFGGAIFGAGLVLKTMKSKNKKVKVESPSSTADCNAPRSVVRSVQHV